MADNGELKSRFQRLDGDRQQHLERARKCASLTIPHLLPPQGTGPNEALDTPYQSMGARAVNNLASKLWLTLLPPDQPFFKLALSTQTKQELKQAGDDGVQESEIRSGLHDIANTILESIEHKGLRSPAHRAVLHLVATGNSLVYIPPAGKDHHGWKTAYGMKVFRLDEYVVTRDTLGNLMEIVTHEKCAFHALPQDVQDKLIDRVPKDENGKPDRDKEVDIYTQVLRTEKEKFTVKQESLGVKLDGRGGEVDADQLPWMALRWSQDGDYGRGPVEEYLGDLQSLESLSQAIIEGSLAASKLIFLVNPNGQTRTRAISRTENCGFAPGRMEDVQPLQIQKVHDFKIASQTKNELEQRLSYAFLIQAAIQRDAERVTAQEIRYMAEELEDAQGGIYSILSQEFQLPLIKLLWKQLVDQGSIPKLPDAAVAPQITTGLEALGRNHKMAKLRNFLQDIAVLGEGVVAEYIRPSEYMQRAAENYGLDIEGLVRSEEEVAQNRQQQMRQQAMQEATPGVAQEAVKGAMQDGQEQQQEEQQ